jgi:hypothetical protein
MTTQRQTLVLTGVAAVALVFGATGGAVAGGLVTGKQIKNESVTGKDIKNQSLETTDLSAAAVAALHGANGLPGTPGTPGAPGANGVSGLVKISTGTPVAANTPTSLGEDCPAAKTLISATGAWVISSAAVQIVYEDDNTARVYTTGIPTADTLTVHIVCITAPGP